MNYIELKAEVNPVEIGRDIVIAELAEIGFESFVEFDNGVDAYIQEPLFDESELKNLSSFNHNEFKVTYQLKKIEDQNWNEVWEQNFEPINVDDTCYVRAPFHEKKTDFEFDIIIEPKMSFGTGHHETTHLMIQELLQMDLTDKVVLDMGCGTGVLAILAELKNAKSLLAVDIDEWAYENTVENISRNNCSKIKTLKGGAECIENHQFDVVIANINRNILLQDIKNYVNTLNTEGHLLLSGFFSSDKEILLKETQKYGLKLVAENSKNDWTLLHLINE
jgi:ribosomal protein L11 methyltransferase